MDTPTHAPPPATSPATKSDPKNPQDSYVTKSKTAYLAGLPASQRRAVEAAYLAGAVGTGVRLTRATRPDGTPREGDDEAPEWVYRLLEASFAVEDEQEHRGRDVTELRRRRNVWLDRLGENEPNPVRARRG